MKKKKFNPETFHYRIFEKEAIEKLKRRKGLSGEGGVFTGMIKRILDTALREELNAHIEGTETSNRRNGHTEKKP